MIAEILFYLMFTIQILVLSVIHPRILLRKATALMQQYPRDRFPQLYPNGVAGIEGVMRGHRVLNAIVAVTGFSFLVGIYQSTHGAYANSGRVGFLVFLYCLIQFIPMVQRAVAIGNFNRSLREQFAVARRTAELRRRRLLDFISPIALALAGVLYVSFVLLVIYIERNPYPGFGGYVNILTLTLIHFLSFCVVWIKVYGRKANPYVSHDARLHNIGIHVKSVIYGCMALTAFRILVLLLGLADAPSFEPAAQSAFIVCLSTLFVAALSKARVSVNPDVAKRPALVRTS